MPSRDGFPQLPRPAKGAPRRLALRAGPRDRKRSASTWRVIARQNQKQLFSLGDYPDPDQKPSGLDMGFLPQPMTTYRVAGIHPIAELSTNAFSADDTFFLIASGSKAKEGVQDTLGCMAGRVAPQMLQYAPASEIPQSRESRNTSRVAARSHAFTLLASFNTFQPRPESADRCLLLVNENSERKPVGPGERSKSVFSVLQRHDPAFSHRFRVNSHGIGNPVLAVPCLTTPGPAQTLDQHPLPTPDGDRDKVFWEGGGNHGRRERTAFIARACDPQDVAPRAVRPQITLTPKETETSLLRKFAGLAVALSTMEASHESSNSKPTHRTRIQETSPNPGGQKSGRSIPPRIHSSTRLDRHSGSNDRYHHRIQLNSLAFFQLRRRGRLSRRRRRPGVAGRSTTASGSGIQRLESCPFSQDADSGAYS